MTEKKKRARGTRAAPLDSDLVTPQQGAAITRQSVSRIRRAIHAGILPGIAAAERAPPSSSEVTSRAALIAWTLAGAPESPTSPADP